MEMLTNLLTIAVCMAACYLPYYFVFKRYTFFTLNRWYLLASLVVSLAIPFIHIKTSASHGFSTKMSITEMQEGGAIIVNILLPPKHAGVNWLAVIQGVYRVVAAILAIRLLTTITIILYKAAKHSQKVNGQYLIYQHPGLNSSFFNILFLDTDGLTADEQQTVLAHEQAHVRLWHSADNLFVSVLKVIFWFNPFIYLIANSLRQNHEYEVDALIAARQNPGSYATLLYKMSVCNHLQVVNQFSSGGLKGRVNMLFRSKTARHHKLYYIFALLFIGAFSSGFILEGKTMTGKLPHAGSVLLHQIMKPGPPATSTYRVQQQTVTSHSGRYPVYNAKENAITQDTTRIVAWANDSTYVDGEKGITHLYGDAHVTYGKIQIVASYIRINKAEHTIFAKNAKIETLNSAFNDSALITDSLTFNLKTRRAVTFNTHQEP